MTDVGLERRLTKAAQEIRQAFVTCGEYSWYPRGYCQLAARVLGLYLIQEMKIGPVEIICNGTRYISDQLDEFHRRTSSASCSSIVANRRNGFVSLNCRIPQCPKCVSPMK